MLLSSENRTATARCDRIHFTRQAVACAAAIVGALLVARPTVAQPSGALWPSAGQNPQNTRFQANEQKITPANVSGLRVKWLFTTVGEVSATPAVDGFNVYFPDWAGYLYAVNRTTGVQLWRTRIAQASGVPQDKARATPVIAGGRVIVGTQGPDGGGGKMISFDKNTGAVQWVTTLDTHPAAVVTQSATFAGGRIYVGTASVEEGWAASIPGYPCCTFRGSMLALDVDTGAILWKTYMVPPGYSGGAIWGSAPAIDNRRKQVYIATGNNYSIPPPVLACALAAGDNPDARLACLDPANHFDSVLALDSSTGAIRWATRALSYDVWTVDCLPSTGSGANCPTPAGPDYDFGQAPALFTVATERGGGRDLVGAGQKSGQYWTFDPDSGGVVWMTQTGPGGVAGGLQWGSAVDGKRIYTANANSGRQPWTLPDGTVTSAGIWSGLDAATGRILWQTTPHFGGGSSGPATTANGVVFGCALDSAGYMYALDAQSGATLWSYPSGGSCLSGAAISQGTVFWGSGYTNHGFGTFNNKVYAFSID